jgi:DNA polymerase III delta subunit
MERIVLDLDTPSMFGDPTLWLIRGDGAWIRKHADVLRRALGSGSADSGCIILALGRVEKGRGNDGLAMLLKEAGKASALHEVEAPAGRELPGWLCGRLGSMAQGVDRPLQVAQALIEHLGEDVDALLGAIDLLAVYNDEQAIDLAAVTALVTGTAERPIWDFTGAVLEGNSRRAIELMRAGQGLEPQQALSALIGELRKLIACCESPDDGQVASWIGARGRPNLYYARGRSRTVGKRNLVRLLNGCLQTQRQLRQSGIDPELAMEVLVLHAQRLVRSQGRGV